MVNKDLFDKIGRIFQMTDTERLDWLEKEDGSALLSDDCGHWTVSTEGMQNLPMDPPDDISTSFYVEKDQWHKSIRDAIDAAIKEQKEYEDE